MISANNVDVNKRVDKMLIPGRNVLPHNVMQTNLGPSWGFSSNKHVQTAREFHDFNMDLVVWTRPSFIWQWLQTAMRIGVYARMFIFLYD